MEIRKGYVQVNAEQLAHVLDQVDGSINPGHHNAKSVRLLLSKLRQRIRSKNQDFLAANPIAAFDLKSDKHQDLLRQQRYARESQALCHRVGQLVSFMYSGTMRMAEIKGPSKRGKSFILLNMLPLPIIPAYGNFSRDESISGGKDKFSIHLSSLLRNDQGHIVTVKKEDCNVQ